MNMMKTAIISGLALVAITTTALAQSGTKSPYSQYGLGVLSDQAQGGNLGMNGVGLGLRSGNQVNTLNPASYSAVDSLTMIFDMGMSGRFTNFKEGTTRVNASGASFDYAVGLFRAAKGVGVSFGILPFSNVGYSYSVPGQYMPEFDTKIPVNYQGSGGLRQVFVGAGWQPLKPLSVGFNIAYLWGNYDRQVYIDPVTNVNSISKVYSATVSSYNLNFGLQWEQPISRNDQLTLGATVGIGHRLNADAMYTVMMTSLDSVYTITGALDLPMTYGVGLSYSHANRLKVAADVELQQWGKLKVPEFNTTTDNYELTDGLLKDRWKVNVGADYVPNPMNRSYLKRVHYRIGAGYTTPYYKISGFDAPKELSVSVGFGLPITNGYNNRSVLNLSAQWQRASSDRFITENTFRINIGLTFNEKWFAKWKVE